MEGKALLLNGENTALQVKHCTGQSRAGAQLLFAVQKLLAPPELCLQHQQEHVKGPKLLDSSSSFTLFLQVSLLWLYLLPVIFIRCICTDKRPSL